MVLSQGCDHVSKQTYLMGIQPDGRFIQHDHFGSMENGIGHTHPLAVALGHLTDDFFRNLLQIALFENLLGALMQCLSG